MSDQFTALEAKMNALEAKLTTMEEEKREVEREAHEQLRSARRSHKRAMYIVASTLLTLVLIGASSYLMAQTAPLTYSGYLEKGGQPVNGTQDVQVYVYDNNTSTSNPLCSSGPSTSNPTVSITFIKGRFKVALNCPRNLLRSKGLWLEVKIKDGSNFVPMSKTRLGTVPYSMSSLQCVRAQKAGDLDNQNQKDLIVSCPAGYLATGGGIVSTRTHNGIRRSQVVIDKNGVPTGWMCSLHIPVGSSTKVYTECQAVCCKVE